MKKQATGQENIIVATIICLCTRVQCVCGVYVCAFVCVNSNICMPRPTNISQALSSTIFGTGSPCLPFLSHCACQASWPVIGLGFSCLHLSSLCGSECRDYSHVCSCIQLSVDSQGVNSGAHTCVANSSSHTQPSPHFRVSLSHISWKIYICGMQTTLKTTIRT